MPEPLHASSEVFDADTPTEAVGAIGLPDLESLGLPRLGWLFVAGAVLVGLLRLGAIDGIDVGTVPYRVVNAIEGATLALLPAALLLRAPDAPRTHPLLLAGLAATALSEIGRAVVAYQPFLGSIALYDWAAPLDLALGTIGVIGLVLTGIGLLRLWPVDWGRTWLLVGIAVGYLVLTYAPMVISAASGIEVSLDFVSAVVPTGSVLASAFATWVAVAAWLDRAQPRALWALLAAALPLRIVIQLIEAAVAAPVWAGNPSGPWLLSLPITGILAATIACLGLLAYVRYTPVADADLHPERPIAGPLRRLSRR